ncbi:MAG: hypothetical protein IPK81_14870 [Rhodospirillales bacterium]|nr:hypothetical protein [Rhodospirillales bacterium]QQS10904.1 MAG: hypothetical protein IPK81_14870 [Rhodospirillales bacterium]
MSVVFGVLAGAAVAAWFTALYAFISLAGKLSGRKSLGAMLFSGIAWFDARNFKAEAAPARRLLVRAFVAFFICVVALAVVSMVLTAPR